MSQNQGWNQCSKERRSKLIFLSDFLQIVFCMKTQLSKAFIVCFGFLFLIILSLLLYLQRIDGCRTH